MAEHVRSVKCLPQRRRPSLWLTDIDAQAAFELPSRESLALVNIIIANVLNGNTVTVKVNNNHVAVQVCAIVQALNASGVAANLTCTITQ